MKRVRVRGYRKYAMAVYAASILAGVVWHAGQASAADQLKLRIGTELSSELPMSNLKPGDRVERTFTVANDGTVAFDYKVRTRFVTGDTEFFDVLQLTVKDGGTVIYDGALHLEQQDIALGRLAAGGENELDLSVVFPEEAGNEYQGKAATIAFSFSAYAEEPSSGGGGGSNPPGEGPSQPNNPTPVDPGNPEVKPDLPSGQPPENPPADNPDSSTPEQPEHPALPPQEQTQTPTEPGPGPGPGDSGPGMMEELPQTANPWFNLILISLFATVGTGMFLRKSGRG
ncbi:hypothetical protein IM700_003200 [Paenibacillus sp. DXFW5]|uniref:LPXTG cell wall anchor domain-containing protein n=1 Tax=Paenibacillus rhizolycopersici TaxID=2780073 RepID=A0ABS2H067_9BACL|nr:hypothetical protein [Paenibacillus rhizolycopersici]MBM6994667.1 hypothetical protein [Paenibacillus rhizolycopersici]